MQTIQLKVNDKIYDKFLDLLSRFNKDEVEVLSNNNSFEANRDYLKKELAEIDSENSIFISLEEFENSLDKTIKKLETSHA